MNFKYLIVFINWLMNWATIYLAIRKNLSNYRKRKVFNDRKGVEKNISKGCIVLGKAVLLSGTEEVCQ